jgi:hypothetical protein
MGNLSCELALPSINKMVGTIPVFNRDDSSPSERVRNKKTLGSFCRVPLLDYGRDDWI